MENWFCKILFYFLKIQNRTFRHVFVLILAIPNSQVFSFFGGLEPHFIFKRDTAKTGPLLTPNFEKSILFGYFWCYFSICDVDRLSIGDLFLKLSTAVFELWTWFWKKDVFSDLWREFWRLDGDLPRNEKGLRTILSELFGFFVFSLVLWVWKLKPTMWI